jgi:hypothetical protein
MDAMRTQFLKKEFLKNEFLMLSLLAALGRSNTYRPSA